MDVVNDWPYTSDNPIQYFLRLSATTLWRKDVFPAQQLIVKKCFLL